jgi:ribose 5-phosphate isomerase A
LTREKIVAAASKEFVCIVDGSKRVEKIGKFPLPVEVIPMSRELISRQIIALCGPDVNPVWRKQFVTDNGNHILDIHGLSLAPNDVVAFEQKLNNIVGVVTCGLFAMRSADVVLVGTKNGVETIRK